MRLLETVTFVPPREQFQRVSRWLTVWKALVEVPITSYLPVQCRSTRDAAILKQECRHRGLDAERRKDVVYIKGCAAKPIQIEDHRAVSA